MTKKFSIAGAVIAIPDGAGEGVTDYALRYGEALEEVYEVKEECKRFLPNLEQIISTLPAPRSQEASHKAIITNATVKSQELVAALEKVQDFKEYHEILLQMREHTNPDIKVFATSLAARANGILYTTYDFRTRYEKLLTTVQKMLDSK